MHYLGRHRGVDLRFMSDNETERIAAWLDHMEKAFKGKRYDMVYLSRFYIIPKPAWRYPPNG